MALGLNIDDSDMAVMNHIASSLDGLRDELRQWREAKEGLPAAVVQFLPAANANWGESNAAIRQLPSDLSAVLASADDLKTPAVARRFLGELADVVARMKGQP
jgi:hypothetical protein